MTEHTQTCANCNSNITGEIYHQGFSDMVAIYCDCCPNVLLIKDFGFFEKNGIEFPNLVAGDDGWQEYNRHLLPYYEKAEKHFPMCSCGCTFKYMAAPRCPNCNDYISGEGYEDKPIYRNIRHVFVTKEAKYI